MIHAKPLLWTKCSSYFFKKNPDTDIFSRRNFYCSFGTVVVEMEHLMASLVQHELLVGHHQLMV